METLKSFLETAHDWEEMPLKNVPGVFAVKIPATKQRPALLGIKVNPMSNKDGRPMKKKGLYLTSKAMLDSFAEKLNDQRTCEAVEIIEEINTSLIPEKKYLDLSLKEE